MKILTSALLNAEITPAFFVDNQFNVNTVNTKTFIAMLASNSPRSFISGANVDLTVTLSNLAQKNFIIFFLINTYSVWGKTGKRFIRL